MNKHSRLNFKGNATEFKDDDYETTKEILIDKVMKIKTSFNYSDRAEQLWSMDEDDLEILLKEFGKFLLLESPPIQTIFYLFALLSQHANSF